MVHARLGIAAENSGKLVSMVRQQAKELAEKEEKDLVIVDGPPGIGCPVIASIGGVTLVLIVTEPTLSGLHDLKRILEVAKHFNVPAMVCINKYDINEDNTHEIEQYCLSQDIAIAAKIPFDNVVTESLLHGMPVVKYSGGKVSQKIGKLWKTLDEALKEKVEG